MRASTFLSVLVLLSASTLALSRPSSFESDRLVKDAQGVFHKTADLKRSSGQITAEDAFEYRFSFHPDVIRLDQEHTQVESIQCLPDSTLVMELSPESITPEWNRRAILVGGKEWKCRGEDGELTQFAVRMDKMKRIGDKLYVDTVAVTEEEVLQNFQAKWQLPRPQDEKRGSKAWNENLAWNYEKKNGKADNVLSLLHVNCSTPKISDDLLSICKRDIKFQFNVLCLDCWSSFDLDITFLWDGNSKTLITEGKSHMNLTLQVDSTVEFVGKFPDVLTYSIPMLGTSVPGIADIGIFFKINLDLDVRWKVVGGAVTGAYVEGNYQLGAGSTDSQKASNGYNFAPQMVEPGISATGEGDVKVSLGVGPSFTVKLLAVTFFNAYSQVVPWVNLNFKANAFTFQQDSSIGVNSLFREPWMYKACENSHISRWAVDFGVEVEVGAEGKLISSKWDKVFMQNSWSLAAGCAWPAVPSFRSVNLYFGPSLQQTNLTVSALTSLLYQDLERLLHYPLSGFSSASLRGRGQVTWQNGLPSNSSIALNFVELLGQTSLGDVTALMNRITRDVKKQDELKTQHTAAGQWNVVHLMELSPESGAERLFCLWTVIVSVLCLVVLI